MSDIPFRFRMEVSMDQALIGLYHQHVAAAFDRQMRLSDYLQREGVDGAVYSHRTSTATLTFGDSVHFTAFDIGSHADPDNSWMWAWVHPHLKLTRDNRELGDAVRKLGREVSSPTLLADAQLSCEDALGVDLSESAAHVFAAVVAGVLGFDAYYTMPFTHGRFAVVIRDPRLQTKVPNAVARILTVFPQVLTAIPIANHRAALTAYGAYYGFTAEEAPQTIRLLNEGEEVVRATFDTENRMVEMTGTVAEPEPPPDSGRPWWQFWK
jgi:hypothetical protein